MVVGERRINGHLLARLVEVGADERPYYHALGRAISGLVLDGRIPTHTRLPAERDLAAALGVSRNTVTAAYTWLREHGYLDSRQGAGSWTALPRVGSGRAAFVPDTERIDLGVAAPPAIGGLEEAARAAVERLPAHVGGQGYTLYGLPELRHLIARRFTERGLPTTPDQIMVTNGAQQSISLLMELLVEPGDGVLVESPTYPHALDTARHLDARLRITGVGPEGWNMECVVDGFRQWRPRVAYLVPDFHNPTAALMAERDRATVVAEARRAGTTLIVDESVTELAIDGAEPPPPMAVHDTDGRVFTIGSTAKLLWGGLRIGWIRGTPPMLDRLMVLRQRFDLASPIVEQLTVAELLSDVPGVRAERSRDLRRQRDALATALRDRLPDWRFVTPGGGLVLWAKLPQPVASRLAEAASRHGVRVAPGPIFGAEGTLEHFVRLAYTMRPEVLADAVRRLAHAHADVAARPTSAPAPGELYV
ncbi:MocR-like transcription factor YczR [Marinitenerispora sediminis]|uniref:GntR family transcriptional regulator n=1 Tax=Marinitenerispora sediminis TaxID=1931232 RepID=A0A368T5S1_9ACTN|nr:PLP-dependent aminotransferase family protein [Marinitenerispora sediminis]RCV57425.1 GntR family transcriptional regulator [Marinitenerispora sediminis]RCV58974.1 GntR family transcriptional regulator [Marinitenerispora sediminis]RCV61265.1 GntR family transcriptional regulator [Marinitenerispora sediminis]